MSKEAPGWLVEVCRRMRWDVSEWDATDNGDWEREGEIGDGDPDITVTCDYDGTPLAIRWELGWHEQVGDVDHDWSAADIIEAFGAASRAMDASLDASRAARDTDTDTDNTGGM